MQAPAGSLGVQHCGTDSGATRDQQGSTLSFLFCGSSARHAHIAGWAKWEDERNLGPSPRPASSLLPKVSIFARSLPQSPKGTDGRWYTPLAVLETFQGGWAVGTGSQNSAGLHPVKRDSELGAVAPKD